ncbi:MAG: molybdate ABC transporter permease subunit [Alphaproteobacteria bacterium]|nr:molybdate ABC transporter permease subunit [Alphaproteobacteria bacterium]
MTPAELEALALSLQVAALGTLAALPAAVPLAWLLARRSFPGKAVVEAILGLPLVLPPVVTGYLLLVLLGRRGLLGGPLGLDLAFTTAAAALVAGVMGFPLLLRALRLSIEAVDPRLEQAARTLGAGPVDTFRAVTLPLAWPGLLSGALLCFARALGEFGATITFAGNIPGTSRTLTLAIWSALQAPGGDLVAARMVALSVGLALSAAALGEWLARRGGARR